MSCFFRIDTSPLFRGTALGTKWNGFDNVAIKPDVRQQIVDWLTSTGNTDQAADLASQPVKDGMISLANGYATVIDTSRWLNEHPDFATSDMPDMPSPHLMDTSWHNDACPSWTDIDKGVQIFVDHSDPVLREVPGTRFTVLRLHPTANSTTLLDTDIWQEVVDCYNRLPSAQALLNKHFTTSNSHGAEYDYYGPQRERTNLSVICEPDSFRIETIDSGDLDIRKNVCDPRELVALRYALQNFLDWSYYGVLKAEKPYSGFVCNGTLIYNPFADETYSDWETDDNHQLADPHLLYGEPYERWLHDICGIPYVPTASAIANHFVYLLTHHLEPYQWDEMRRRNADLIGDLSCASHDFLDANEIMSTAMEELIEDFTIENEAYQALWNDAWDIAKRQHLTASPDEISGEAKPFCALPHALVEQHTRDALEGLIKKLQDDMGVTDLRLSAAHFQTVLPQLVISVSRIMSDYVSAEAALGQRPTRKAE